MLTTTVRTVFTTLAEQDEYLTLEFWGLSTSKPWIFLLLKMLDGAIKESANLIIRDKNHKDTTR